LSRKPAFTLIRPDCAGIDLGSCEHYVAVPEDRCVEEVRTFGCFTCDLLMMGQWLLDLGIRDVAMEATGVYWIPVYESLSSRGLRVTLVDGRSAKALPGRKTDVQDSQWIRDLHMHGLLKACVVPDAQILVLRSYWRERERLIQSRAEQIQLMQKALEQMNVQIHKVLSDISGVSGQSIIRAILAGERNPKALSSLLVGAANKKQAQVEKALEGNWADHHLFALEGAVSTYDFLSTRLLMCDRRLDEAMSELSGIPPGSPRRPRASKNEPEFNLQTHLTQLLGQDATAIDGLDVTTIATAVSELGPDLSRFRTKKHFTSYLGLCSVNKITGGNIKSSRTRRVTHRLANAFRMAAQSVHSSRSALGAFHRRLKARIGPAKATTATARKLAEMYYTMVVEGKPFQDPGEEAYNERFKQQRIRALTKQASRLGFQLVEVPQAPPLHAFS
jgi:transposase